MKKIPSAKSLLYLLLFATIYIFTNNDAWAYLADQAKEYHLQADKLQSEGKLDEAIEYYQKAIGIDRYFLAAYNGLAICYEKKHLPRQAEEWYLKALEINPEYAPVHYNLGLFYEKYGNIEKAVFHWRQRVRLGHPASPGTIKARAKLKRYAPDKLQEEEAREFNQTIAEKKEKDALDKVLGRNRYKTKEDQIQDNYLEGMQRYEEGDYRAAAESFQKMIDALPVSN